VYIISGNDSLPENQTSRFQKNLDWVFKLDLTTFEIIRRAPIPEARQAFGICSIGKYIYVAGGLNNDISLDSVHRYDCELNCWEELAQKLPFPAYAFNLITVEKRWIFGFGMTHNDINSKVSRLITLDTWNLTEGWKVTEIESEFSTACC
jgi:hypothetical protein